MNGNAVFALVLAGLAAFERWNHDTGALSFAAGAVLPELVPARRAAHLATGPLALGVAGFFVPRGNRLQVAALGWAAHVYLHRALGYDARD
jgi:hypothetical protein